MAVLPSNVPGPPRRRRLLLLGVAAAIGLGVLAWRGRGSGPTSRSAPRAAEAGPGAIEKLRSAIVADPASPSSYAALGDAYLAGEEYDRAVQPLEMAASLAPDLPHIQCRLADAYLHIRDREASVRTIQSALKSEPDCALARLVAGEQWLRDDDLTRSLAEFREAARLEPGSPLAFQRAGYILLELDRPAEAEKLLLEGLRVGPSDTGLHIQLGRMYALRTSDPKALELAHSHYLRALPGNPNASTVKASLGEVAQQAGKPDEAQRWWEEALEANRNETKALYGMGQMLLASGKRTEGQALLARYAAGQKFQREVTALRMQTTTRPTRDLRMRFARLALDSSRLDEAERQLAALLRDYPADPAVRRLQGALYVMQQRPEDAQREYRLANALPGEPAR